MQVVGASDVAAVAGSARRCRHIHIPLRTAGAGAKDCTGFNACGFGKLGRYFEVRSRRAVVVVLLRLLPRRPLRRSACPPAHSVPEPHRPAAAQSEPTTHVCTRAQVYYAAMNPKQFARGAACGGCIAVAGAATAGRRVLVKVVDECGSGCHRQDVDFSLPALFAITGYAADRKPVNWTWMPCTPAGARVGTRAPHARACWGQPALLAPSCPQAAAGPGPAAGRP